MGERGRGREVERERGGRERGKERGGDRRETGWREIEINFNEFSDEMMSEKV